MSNYPLILYFKSQHCAPCKPIEKMLDEINISLFGNRLNIRKIDIAKELELARKHNVMAVPTVIIGKVRLSVIIDKNELTDAILQGFLSSVSFEDEPQESEKTITEQKPENEDSMSLEDPDHNQSSNDVLGDEQK